MTQKEAKHFNESFISDNIYVMKKVSLLRMIYIKSEYDKALEKEGVGEFWFTPPP